MAKIDEDAKFNVDVSSCGNKQSGSVMKYRAMITNVAMHTERKISYRRAVYEPALNIISVSNACMYTYTSVITKMMRRCSKQMYMGAQRKVFVQKRFRK